MRAIPWGDDYGDAGAWMDRQEVYLPWIPASRPDVATPEGCFAMVTGRWEWCANRFAPYPGASLDALEELFPGCAGGGRSRRGGDGRYLVPSAISRSAAPPDIEPSDAVFRLVKPLA